MNTSLWIAQILFGLFFFVSGYGKAFTPWDQLQHIPWIGGVTPEIMRLVGWSEILGAIGVILPAALRIKPVLTPVAAAQLVVIMVLATAFHLVRAEHLLTIPCVVLAAMGSFIAYGRVRLKPIQER
jgi:uncharacterized membrane protein YphA (DoxX/SURF4 family)